MHLTIWWELKNLVKLVILKFSIIYIFLELPLKLLKNSFFLKNNAVDNFKKILWKLKGQKIFLQKKEK